MKELLAALELHLKKNRPELWASLSAGLMNDAIAALQQDHKVLLPQSVKRLYRWHNGQHNQDGASFVNGYFFLPLERMLELVSALPDGYYRFLEAFRAATLPVSVTMHQEDTREKQALYFVITPMNHLMRI